MIKNIQRYYFNKKIRRYLNSELSINNAVKIGRLLNGKHSDLFTETEKDHYLSSILHRCNEPMINALIRTGLGRDFSPATLNLPDHFCKNSLISCLDTLLEVKPDAIADVLLSAYKTKSFGLIYHFSQRAEINEHELLMKKVMKHKSDGLHYQVLDILKRCNENSKYRKIIASYV